MKHLNLAFAGVVAGSLALSAQAGVSTWWSEDFSDYSLDIQAMTNDYTKGTWTMAAGDGSTLKASYSNQVECLGGLSAAPENVLALSTEGNDLKFEPTPATAVSSVTVVDADVFFVGSESAPSFTDTDIQFAMYLQVPEDGSANAVMVYVRDQGNAGWVALDGTSTIADKTWHHVQVKIDYSVGTGRSVNVIIDGSDKTPEGGLVIANGATSATGLTSVSFRGTGAVDNFAGGWETVDPLPLHTFTASAYVDGVLDQTVEIAAAEDIQAGTDASFEVARTVGTKTIAKIVVKGFESASDTEYTVTDDGTDFTVTPSGLDVDATDPSVVFINVPTDDAATTGAAQTYPALEVWYATPAPPTYSASITLPTGCTLTGVTVNGTPVTAATTIEGLNDDDVVVFTYENADGVTKTATATIDGANATATTEAYTWADYLGAAVSGAYQIDDAADLELFRKGVAAGLATAGETFKQTANIDMSSAGAFAGIGAYAKIPTAGTPFLGTYDGQGYTIANVTRAGGNTQGIFNQVGPSGVIENLVVSNMVFATDVSGEYGFAIVGNAGGGATLRNLTAAGVFGSAEKPSTHNMAGIVVRLAPGASSGAATTIDSCTNNATIYGAYTKLGGINAIVQNQTGFVDGKVVFVNCANNGTLVCKRTYADCHPEGKDPAPVTGNAGIVGYIAGTNVELTGCYGNGAITNADGANTDKDGALVGWTYGGTIKDNGGNSAPSNKKMIGTWGSATETGFLYATVANDIATTISGSPVAGGNYLLEGNAAPVIALAAGESVAFDTALGYTLDDVGITAGTGAVLSYSTSGTVTTYTATAAAAQIGTTLYATFDAALAAAQAGDTITLLANVALTSTVTVNKNLTIDLNGNNVTATDCRAFHVTAGAFALTGEGTVSTVVTQGTSMASSGSVIRVGSDTAATSFTLGEDVTVSSDYCYGVTYFGTQPQTVVLNGTVTVTGAQAAISGNGLARNAAVTLTVGETAVISATQDYAIYNPQTGTTTINGTVTGPGGVEVKAGTVTVGPTATITATGTPSYSQSNQNGTSTSGYAIAAVGNSAYQQPAAAVVEEGAKVTGTVIVLEENNSTTYGSITSDAELTAPTGYLWVEGEEAGTVELVKAFTVTFTTDHGTAPAAQTVANGAVATEPTAPEATGWTFKGWTLEGAAYSFSTPVTADITLVAAWEENAQPVKPQVNPGDNLPAGTAPMSFGADGKCTVRFIAPAAGTYVLLSSTTVDAADPWTADGTPVTVEAGATVELTEGTSAPAKFFKIGWEKK